MESYDTPRFWEFVNQNIDKSPAALRLKYHGRDDADRVDYALAITQIECRRKFASKLRDTLAADPRFVFACELAGEQSTSDALAAFHASLVPGRSRVTDLTCGLGIDAIHMARGGSAVTAIDRQVSLVDALNFNAANLGLTNLTAECANCVERVKEGRLGGDVAFIDPARRAADGSRVFAVTDCRPDVTELIPFLRDSFHRLIVKLSPMLDVTQTMRLLGGELSHVYILGTRTECKELVCVMDFGTDTPALLCPVDCVTLSDSGQSVFRFTRGEELEAPAPAFATPRVGDYVYEPWPAVMKASPARVLLQRFPGLAKLSANTNVFFSSAPLDGFPGVARQVREVIPWQSKNIKRLKNSYPRIDVAVRNFGMSADDLQKKIGIRQGGEYRLLAVTDADGQRLLLVLGVRH